jgi:hypothetical protein
VERVGNLLGQIANLKPRKVAGGSPSAAAVEIKRTESTLQAGAAITAANRPGPHVEPNPPLNADETNHRVRDYVPRRRRPGVSTDLTRIKGILSKALAHKGLDKKIERYEFILHWQEIVGESLARISKPECIVNKALIVRVVHSTWAQELAFMKPVLIQKVIPYLKKGDMINDIVFRVGSVN